MKRPLSKLIPIACALSSPLLISADDYSNTARAKNGSDTAASMDKVITPPAGPLVSNGADFYLTADFIWWKAQQDGLAYAFNGTLGGDPAAFTTNADKGSLHEPHFKYEPGFKVGLGLLSNHDNWDFFAQYTWLKVDPSATKNHFDENETDNLLMGTDNFEQSGLYFSADKAEGKWGMHFNVLDVEMGRSFWLSKRLSTRPHVGLKFSWIKQDFDVEFHTPVLDLSPHHELEYDYDLKQFGVGVRAGLNNSFYMANNWSIFGDLAITGMWNSFKSSRIDHAQLSSGSSEFKVADVHYRPHTVTMVAELDLGLRFETIFSKGRYMYMLQAGWETQVWFNQGQFVNLTSLSNPGNLSMQGLTIKTGFYF